MAANFSEIDVANKALLRVSANQIESDDGTIAGIITESLEAKLMQLNYDLIQDIVCEDRVWSFALKRQLLEFPSPAPPVHEYSYQFPLPTDCLNMWRVYTDRSGTVDKWIVEGNQILSNNAAIYVHYVKRLSGQDLLTATPQFVDSLSLRLALEVCMPLTENAALYESLRSEYEYRLVNASSIDGSQATHESFKSNNLTNVRAGFSHRR